MRILPHIARVVAIIAIPTSLATATTTINVSTISNYLDGGNTTAAPDAYRGTTGNGWASGWELPNSLSASLVDVVRESDETEFYDTPYQELTTGSGNYLYVEAGLEADAVGAVSVGRKVGDGRLGIDLTAAYTIEFLFRVDESDLSWNFTTADDRYQLYDYPTLTNGSRTGVGWFISAVGDHPANSLGSVDWVFYDGQGRTGSTGT
ncbi:MAG: hypothetical protein GX621_04325, partial [Pirellulaceae bacterium]|nr:hypothetical protein [Pirellulaceae bacterium]